MAAAPIVRASRDVMNNALIPSPSPGGRREKNALDNWLTFSPREKGPGDEGKQPRVSPAFRSRVAATVPFFCVAVLGDGPLCALMNVVLDLRDYRTVERPAETAASLAALWNQR